jgi:hypothetical protein
VKMGVINVLLPFIVNKYSMEFWDISPDWWIVGYLIWLMNCGISHLTDELWDISPDWWIVGYLTRLMNCGISHQTDELWDISSDWWIVRYLTWLMNYGISHLTNGEDLQGIHTNFRIKHLEFTVASVHHKHDTVHYRETSTGILHDNVK